MFYWRGQKVSNVQMAWEWTPPSSCKRLWRSMGWWVSCVVNVSSSSKARRHSKKIISFDFLANLIILTQSVHLRENVIQWQVKMLHLLINQKVPLRLAKSNHHCFICEHLNQCCWHQECFITIAYIFTIKLNSIKLCILVTWGSRDLLLLSIILTQPLALINMLWV